MKLKEILDRLVDGRVIYRPSWGKVEVQPGKDILKEYLMLCKHKDSEIKSYKLSSEDKKADDWKVF